MKLSLAIINDNGALYLKRFFESLGSWKDLLDIVFVDNCSCDNSIQIVKDLRIGKIVAFEKKEVSRPVLYNAAASRTEGEYVLFTHSDIIFGDGFFKNLDKSLKERTDLDFMNFRVMYVDKTTSAPSIVYRYFEDKRIKLSYQSIWGISDPALKKLISCSESCFLVNSAVFKYEHFDERYFDTLFIEDLLVKLDFQGANIVCDEDSYIEHYFLEEHKGLRTLKYDIRLFIKNNLKELQALNIIKQDRQISSLETNLQEKVAQIHSLEYQIHSLEYQIHSLEYQIHRLEYQVHNLESQIQLIEGSIPMQLLNRYQRIVERLLRLGTRRRRYYELGLTGIRVILNEGWRSFFRKVRIWFPSVVWQTGRAVYYRLPVSISTKAKLVRFVMKCGGRFFQNVGSYRQWKQLQEREPAYKQPSPHPGFYDASKREPFNFPDAPSPVVSVIIPVHNKSKYTYACLYSIYENRPDVEFEVIVVDDCSTDDTQELLKTIGGIQVIQNVTNLGFAGSVNCGAEVARGEYLLILNNDTLVHPDWMDELFAVMSSQPDIGLVGSQLIYPDGRLQESGCLMCQDGCAVPLGRFEDLLHPEFSYFREVDFCSAASILVRRKEFHKVGGLSTAYAPAYFEDVDFAFKLRGIGKRVFVQPLSKVTHYEAVSYSRELSADLIAQNRRIFVEKWQSVLQQCSYASVENFRTTPNYNHKRVLYIDAIVPVPDRGAGSIDAFWYMRFLVEAGYDVVFYGEHTPTSVPKYTPMIQRIGVQCLYLPYIGIERYLSEHGSSFSHVFVARVYQAMSFNSLIRRYCPNARYIFNTVDVHFLREMRQAEVEKSPAMLEQAKQTKENELGIMEQADATIVVSTEEKELLEREYGMKRIYHVPLVREVYGCKQPYKDRRDIVFIGSAHLPNVDATYYFHSEIFPLIQRELPDVKFIVIGEYLKDALKEQAEFDKLVSDPSVELAGFVEDLSEYFEWIRVMVAPLRYGSGVKGKIVTGFQYGVPCVSTSIGLEGIGLTPEFNVLQADDSVSFAKAVVRLYTDQALWERLSENCMIFTREHFSEEIARRELLKIFAQTNVPYKEVI